MRNFVSDSQRRACFANINRFSLKDDVRKIVALGDFDINPYAQSYIDGLDQAELLGGEPAVRSQVLYIVSNLTPINDEQTRRADELLSIGYGKPYTRIKDNTQEMRFAKKSYAEIKSLKDERAHLMNELNNMMGPTKERRHEIIMRLDQIDDVLVEDTEKFSYPSEGVLSSRPEYVFDGFVKYSIPASDKEKKSKQAVFGVAYGDDSISVDVREPKEGEIDAGSRQLYFGEEYKQGRVSGKK